ncbi:unnamed protein product [Schistosoma margrebowiei]|uniref:Uncharacterized protein n=1 Tax=Schistosoma margrebowiei TaxID=48269 RepID=A0A183M7U6_9TREM|nr:unnamed protein product [Schistosoma margrebowiei]
MVEPTGTYVLANIARLGHHDRQARPPRQGSSFGRLGICNDHLSLSTTSESGIESHSRPELNETQNPCEATVSNQSTYQISHVIVPDMVFPNNSYISDETSYKFEKNMLSEPNHDRKPDVVLIDGNFSNDPLLCNDIRNKFEETISEESNLDVISNIICSHNALVSCGKLVQCAA